MLVLTMPLSAYRNQYKKLELQSSRSGYDASFSSLLRSFGVALSMHSVDALLFMHYTYRKFGKRPNFKLVLRNDFDEGTG